MSEKRKVYRQGDVILRETFIGEPLTQELRKREVKTLEISGETGHKHSIKGHVGREVGSRTLLLLETPEKMTHPQHATLDIPEGAYEVYRTREYEDRIGQRLMGD